MSDKLLEVGNYKDEFNKILGVNIDSQLIYRSTGLPAHMIKRKHFNCLKYIDYISDIIENPDYVGINPNEDGESSIEFIKRYKINVLICVKLDSDKNHMYVSTMHDISESKILRRLHSGRLKEFPKRVDT